MKTRTILTALLTMTLVSGAARAEDCTDLEAKISASATAAQHGAVATCYDDMAKQAQAQATKHAAMGAAYQKSGGAPAAASR